MGLLYELGLHLDYPVLMVFSWLIKTTSTRYCSDIQGIVMTYAQHKYLDISING